MKLPESTDRKMGIMKYQKQIKILSVFIAILLMSSSAVSGDTSTGAAIVVQIEGKVTYQDKTRKKPPSIVQAFMKIYLGDRLVLSKESQITLLYLTNGLREKWQTNSTKRIVIIIEKGGGQVEGENKLAIKPKLDKLPNHVIEPIEETALPFPNERIKRGGVKNVRSGESDKDKSEFVPIELTKEELSEIDEARKTYVDLKKRLGANDITPELYILSVYAEYEQYIDMHKIFKELLKKNSTNPVLIKWMERFKQ